MAFNKKKPETGDNCTVNWNVHSYKAFPKDFLQPPFGMIDPWQSKKSFNRLFHFTSENILRPNVGLSQAAEAVDEGLAALKILRSARMLDNHAPLVTDTLEIFAKKLKKYRKTDTGKATPEVSRSEIAELVDSFAELGRDKTQTVAMEGIRQAVGTLYTGLMHLIQLRDFAMYPERVAEKIVFGMRKKTGQVFGAKCHRVRRSDYVKYILQSFTHVKSANRSRGFVLNTGTIPSSESDQRSSGTGGKVSTKKRRRQQRSKSLARTSRSRESSSSALSDSFSSPARISPARSENSESNSPMYHMEKPTTPKRSLLNEMRVERKADREHRKEDRDAAKVATEKKQEELAAEKKLEQLAVEKAERKAARKEIRAATANAVVPEGPLTPKKTPKKKQRQALEE